MAVFTPSAPRGFREKLYEVNWAFVLLILLIGCIGVGMLYSVEGGAWDPYASRHALRFGLGVLGMIVVALFPPRFWMGIAYPAYLGALVLLIGVEVFGVAAMGAMEAFWECAAQCNAQTKAWLGLGLGLILTLTLT